jgi:hypothetical protein
MAIKVKELKNDTIIDVKVNNNFYKMLKHVLFYLFNQMPDPAQREESLKKIMAGKYEEMNDTERSFYTITVLLAEIERVAKESSLYEEKDILQPGDEGYEAPTQE